MKLYFYYEFNSNMSSPENCDSIVGPSMVEEKTSETRRKAQKSVSQHESVIRQQLEECLFVYVNSENPLEYMKPRAIKKAPTSKYRENFNIGVRAFFRWLEEVTSNPSSLCGYATDGRLNFQLDYTSKINPQPLSKEQINRWKLIDLNYPSRNVYLPKLLSSFSKALCTSEKAGVFDLNKFVKSVGKVYSVSVTLKAVTKAIEKNDDDCICKGVKYLYKTIDSVDIKLPENGPVPDDQKDAVMTWLKSKKNVIDEKCDSICSDYVNNYTGRDKDWVDGFMQGARFITRVSSEYGGCGEIQDLQKSAINGFICNSTQKNLWQILSIEHWSNMYFNSCTSFVPRLYHFSKVEGLIPDNKYSIAEGWHLIAMRDMDGKVISGSTRPGQLPLMDATPMNTALDYAVQVSKDKRESSYQSYFEKYSNDYVKF